MNKFISFFVSPLYVKESKKYIRVGDSAIQLRDFQYELLKIFLHKETKDVILLTAPTGAGKTLSLLIPLFANLETTRWSYQGSVGLYPSKELAKDQMISIANMLIKLGATPVDVRKIYRELESLNNEEVKVVDEYIKSFEIETIRVVLFYITSESLRDLSRVFSKLENNSKELQSRGLRNKDVLDFLWERVAGNAYRIVFTVPEYPYLAGTGVYQEFHRAGIWLYSTLKMLSKLLKILEIGDVKGLRRWFRSLEVGIDSKRLFEEYYISRGFLKDLADIFLFFRVPVFFDEFHLYSRFTFTSFLALLYILLYERGVGKIIISSATPVKEVLVRGKKSTARRDYKELIRSLVEGMGYTFREVRAESSPKPEDGYTQIRKRTLIKVIPVILMSKHVTGIPAFGLIQRYLPEILEKYGWLNDYARMKRSMILVDRVSSVLEVADKVRELTREEPLTLCSVKGLLEEQHVRGERVELRKEKLIIGNMSIAFGVDIQGMDLGVIIAKDYVSALQKIGRIGRGSGEEYAIVYLPIPSYKYNEVREKLKAVEGKEIPYVKQQKGTIIDFITLLKELYPRTPPDIMLRCDTGIFKVIFPVWVYILTTIIRLRDTIREELHLATGIEDVKLLHQFKVLLDSLRIFLRIENIERRLRRFMTVNLVLTPASIYSLYSYRNIVGIPIKWKCEKGVEIVEYIELTTAGRNIPLGYENGEFYVDCSAKRPYEYTDLWIGIYHPENINEVLRELDGKVVNFSLIVELIKEEDPQLFQGSREICNLWGLARNVDLHEVPVEIFYSSSTFRKDLIENLSAIDSMIPIYTVNYKGEKGELLGGLYML